MIDILSVIITALIGVGILNFLVLIFLLFMLARAAIRHTMGGIYGGDK